METTTGRTLETPGGPGSGCKVRGCCMGIPIGCGSLAVLALLVSGVFTAGRNVQDRQDRRERADLRAEVFALRDDLSDASDALDKQAQRIERIAGNDTPKPARRPFDLHVAASPMPLGDTND